MTQQRQALYSQSLNEHIIRSITRGWGCEGPALNVLCISALCQKNPPTLGARMPYIVDGQPDSHFEYFILIFWSDKGKDTAK